MLTGESYCEWASWFKVQHYGISWARMPSDFDLSQWLMDHTALLNELRGNWERQGYSVLTEEGWEDRHSGWAAAIADNKQLTICSDGAKSGQ